MIQQKRMVFKHLTRLIILISTINVVVCVHGLLICVQKVNRFKTSLHSRLNQVLINEVKMRQNSAKIKLKESYLWICILYLGGALFFKISLLKLLNFPLKHVFGDTRDYLLCYCEALR